MNFKNLFKKNVAINSKNLHEHVNFMDLESCRTFLTTLSLSGKKVEFIQLANGQKVKMSDIPEDQIIQRAQELRGWILGVRK